MESSTGHLIIAKNLPSIYWQQYQLLYPKCLGNLGSQKIGQDLAVGNSWLRPNFYLLIPWRTYALFKSFYRTRFVADLFASARVTPPSLSSSSIVLLNIFSSGTLGILFRFLASDIRPFTPLDVPLPLSFSYFLPYCDCLFFVHPIRPEYSYTV